MRVREMSDPSSALRAPLDWRQYGGAFAATGFSSRSWKSKLKSVSGETARIFTNPKVQQTMDYVTGRFG